jgi:hypothetical protein
MAEPCEITVRNRRRNDNESLVKKSNRLRHRNNYREHIRESNSAMAFASVGARIKSPPGNGTYCFWIHGQIYHLVSPLYPNEANKPEYGQLYIFDSDEATTKLLENQSNQRCMAEVMQ